MRPPRNAAAVRSLRAGAAALAILGLVAGCSEPAEPENDGFIMLVEPSKKPEGPPLPDSSLWETPLADPALESGRMVWTGTCIQCHSTGLGGAPLIGNRDLWAPRIEQGLDVLVGHATKGFYGKVGEMPARGGNAALSDDEVRLAVRFMATRVEPSL